jgi:RNA polymerase sigma-70 factor (ECF subfamily)
MSDAERNASSIKRELMALIPRLRRFGYSLTGSRDDGDDLAQIALERALMRLDQWRPGTRLDAWVFRIAHNAWIDEIRSRRRRGDPVSIDTAENALSVDGAALAHARLDLASVREGVARLPEEQRAVLALVAIEGFSYQEAAESLSIPIGTVMSRLSRARKALAEHLERKGD